MGFEFVIFGLDYCCFIDWVWRLNGILVDICGKVDNSGIDVMLIYFG